MHRLQDAGRDPREAAPLTTCVGRFAPSPTGPLHFGSLIAAVGSYLEARSRGGRWLVRMEDLDPPREAPGAASRILEALERCGFEWDGAVVFQSRRTDAYLDALEKLEREGHTYRCVCSRRDVARASSRLGGEGPVYAGTCRRRPPPPHLAAAIRVRVGDAVVTFEDDLAGRQRQRLGEEVGDFVLRRRDGLFAYQLAVTIDDAAQHVTHVVRGRDLLDSTPRQILLRRLLRLPVPRFLHLPLAVSPAGAKLSKQTGALALDLEQPAAMVWRALQALAQAPPPALAGSLEDLWTWARENWRLAPLRGIDRIPVTPAGEPAPRLPQA